MTLALSTSEQHGITNMPTGAINVYSVGISTAGVAELHMAELNPTRHIIATTIDEQGVAFAQDFIAKEGMSDRVETKLEDVAQPLPYDDNSFDYIYARLVLHYLSKQDLVAALTEMNRVLKPGQKLFIVVRSVDCPDAKAEDSTYDEATGLTTFHVTEDDGTVHGGKRFFHSEQSISEFVSQAGFIVDSVGSYDEQLYRDFMRTELSNHTDNLIELIAHKP